MRRLETFGWLIIQYYDNRHMRGGYNIHTLINGKTITTESEMLLSEDSLTVKQ
jgi:hypothetical protein